MHQPRLLRVLLRWCAASDVTYGSFRAHVTDQFRTQGITVTTFMTAVHQRLKASILVLFAFLFIVSSGRPAAAADQIYFSAVDDIAAQFVQRINAENTRIDISAWYLTDSTVYAALLNRFRAGVQVRLIGDRGSIFEIDPGHENTFYYLASQGVPIRLRYNPTWYPEI